MLYPDTFEEKIGFDLVRSHVKAHCLSPMGAERVNKLAMMTSLEEIMPQLEMTEEFRQLLLFDEPFPAQDYYDLRVELKRLQIGGTYIESETLAQLRAFINTMTNIYVYLKVRHESEKYPLLWSLCEEMPIQRELTAAFNRILDEKGQIRDNASDELSRIKSEINRISQSADRQIRKILNMAKQDGLVKEDAEMTVRNGRLCIPVTAQFKRRLKGFIHDESATGQTVFIEPAEVFDANNELRDLQNAEQREIIRILTELTDRLRPAIPELLEAQQLLGCYDFLRAKALFAIDIEATLPHISDYPRIEWQQAIHPLLYLTLKKNGKKVVPLNITLKADQRILLISGPNAGGKSVCLKCVGLLQYMMQCGLLVSMQSTSDMGLFQHIFIDIGDEQSIENDLSTYSSHLSNLKVMEDNLDEQSLFLIDEFGSGTEPTLGGALAEAILESYYDHRAFGIITTHYGNLKMFPDSHPEAVNGAMLYNTQELRPLYQLKIGNPGSSFTYEIAKHIGLRDEIIQNAIQKSGTAQIDYERKLEEIETMRLETEKMLKTVHAADDQLAEMIGEYADKFAALDKQRKEILQKAKNQANTIVESANKVIEKTIRDIKEAKAEAEKTKAARQNVATLKKELDKEIESIEHEEVLKPLVPIKVKNKKPKELKPEVVADEKPITVGDAVFLADMQITGEVMKIQGGEATITFNGITLKTDLSKLVKISKKEAREVQRGHVVRYNEGTLADAMNKKLSAFSTTLDVRGQRADEMADAVSDYLDEASILNIRNVRILHGKGNGILRNVVRQLLAKRKDVANFNDEILELGGSGITVVEMKGN
ncbi:MAG: Smr/MutS family protein [Bacteroidales bacterium]|nr:Smr/MutS family protein [Bacteroidales bacterium]